MQQRQQTVIFKQTRLVHELDHRIHLAFERLDLELAEFAALRRAVSAKEYLCTTPQHRRTSLNSFFRSSSVTFASAGATAKTVECSRSLSTAASA